MLPGGKNPLTLYSIVKDHNDIVKSDYYRFKYQGKQTYEEVDKHVVNDVIDSVNSQVLMCIKKVILLV